MRNFSLIGVGGFEPSNTSLEYVDISRQGPVKSHPNKPQGHGNNIVEVSENGRNVVQYGQLKSKRNPEKDTLRAQYKHNEIYKAYDFSENLQKLIRVWETLPEAIKDGILAMVSSFDVEGR